MRFVIYIIIGGLFALWGYNVGKGRRIGSTAGALLGFFLGFIGMIIVYCSARVEPMGLPNSINDYTDPQQDA